MIRRLAIAVLLVASLQITSVLSSPAHPEARLYAQPDGTVTPPLKLNGNQEYAWMSDEKGYHVQRDADGWFVYARKNSEGHMESTGVRVGHKNPRKLGLSPLETSDHKGWLSKNTPKRSKRERRLQASKALCDRTGTKDSPCKLHGLVLLLRFSDHKDRRLPESDAYWKLFNVNGADSDYAPTGSVFDVFMDNSYGAFEFSNTISEWIDVPYTEAYASGGNLGLNTAQTREVWKAGLAKLESKGILLSDLDSNDGQLDALTILHSGAGAEVGDTDCITGAWWEQRIWSHQTGHLGFSANGVETAEYYVASAVTHFCPMNADFNNDKNQEWGIARIGVIAHEFAHFLGLPDLYDYTGGGGVGTFDLLGNMWGWMVQPQWAQLYPPLMSAWTKDQMGWVNVVHITGDIEHHLEASCTSDVVWMVDHNCPEGEYFLLELRFPCSFDMGLDHQSGDWLRDRGGLAIWHVDETNADLDQTTGVPPDENGNHISHYRLALVQGDGEFNLEDRPMFPGDASNGNKGDSADLFMNLWGFRADKAYLIDDSGTTLCDGVTHFPEPNTMAYSTGTKVPTGITIQSDWGYADYMEISVFLEGAGPHNGPLLPAGEV